jgi:adenylate kinase family enzyme
LRGEYQTLAMARRQARMVAGVRQVSKDENMNTILIFGNSGSGKSTLARRLCESKGLAHLDLDTLAWQPTSPSQRRPKRRPQRRPLADSWRDIQAFTGAHRGWVIEGCYTDLLELLSGSASEIIFMDLPVEACVANARNRPWEPHKYESKAAQDANLAMLLDWIADYPHRSDTFSAQAHRQFYDKFTGKKRILTSNDDPV